MQALFEIAHQQRFGFVSPEKDIEIEAIEVEASGGGEAPDEPDAPSLASRAPSPHAAADIFTSGAWHEAPVHLREELQPGHRIEGPSLIIEAHQTVVVEPEWHAEISAKQHLVLTRREKRKDAKVGKQADPVMLEIFNNLFVAVAEQMGYALQNTARSVNIKERLDFSCAIFDRPRTADRKCPAHPGASRLDGSKRRDDLAGSGEFEAGRRLYAERAL